MGESYIAILESEYNRGQTEAVMKGQSDRGVVLNSSLSDHLVTFGRDASEKGLTGLQVLVRNGAKCVSAD